MIVLVGESASGKSTIEKLLVGEEYGFNKVVSYTTRPPRNGETDGVDYHFISKEEFNAKYEVGFFAETGAYRDWYYGSAKEDFTDDKVAVLTPHGFRQLKKANSVDIVSFYIKVPRRDRLIKILDRGDNIEEAYRRNLSDVGMFDGIEDEVDFVIENPGYSITPEFMAKKVFFMYQSITKHINKKLTILCDIDGVVDNLVECVLDRYNQKYNDNVKVEDIKEYSMQKYLNDDCKNVFMEFATEELIMQMNTPDNCVNVVTNLMQNHNFYFVSKTAPDHVASKNKWLKSNFPLYNEDMLIVCGNKQLIRGDVLIEDCLDNLNSDVPLNIVFDKPWNKERKDVEYMRVKSWKEITDVINHKFKYEEQQNDCNKT